MKLGLGLGLWSGRRRSVAETIIAFFNGIPDASSTYTGGPVSALDYAGALQTGALDVPSITGGRLATTVEEGAILGAELFTAPYLQGGGVDNGDGTYTFDGTQASWVYIYGNTLNTVVAGQSYICEFTITEYSAGYVRVGPSPYGTTRNADDTYVDTIVAGVTIKPHILVNGDFIGTIEVKYYKEVIPQWVTTDTEGAEIYSFTLVRGIRKFTDADPLEFKRYLSMPAGTNLFVNPTIPANQDIDLTSVGTGDYTLSVYGSGSVTVAANTATGTGFGTASAGSDVTFNITVAGTITLTVTDTPDIVQVEQNSFATSPVDGVRQTTRLIESTTGEYRANNLCGIIQPIPMGAGQTAWLLHSYVDANNGFGILQEPTQITFRKTASGVDTDCSVSYTHAAGTPVRIGWVQTASGMRIKEQHWTGAAWSSWSSYVEVTTDAGKADLQVADTYEIGSKNGSGVYAGNIQLARPWWSSDPDYLEGV